LRGLKEVEDRERKALFRLWVARLDVLERICSRRGAAIYHGGDGTVVDETRILVCTPIVFWRDLFK